MGTKKLLNTSEVGYCNMYMFYQNVCVITLQIKFVISEDTTVSHLLTLNLHNWRMNHVSSEAKELSMEKTLKELNVTDDKWVRLGLG